jgi:hypothetical protein
MSTSRISVARLPGQAGMRQAVCKKIKESQYVSTTVSESQNSNWVGGALERMGAEKWDPAVLFDQDRKIWVYLHADRLPEAPHDVRMMAVERPHYCALWASNCMLSHMAELETEK